MTPTTISKPDVRRLVKHIASIITQDSTDVIAEALVTLIVYSVTVPVMQSVGHPYLLTFFPGLFALLMIVLWSIRFVRHFDDSATNNELRDQMNERFAELENSLKERLDNIIANMIP